MLLAKLRRGASRAFSGHGWLPVASFPRHAIVLEARSLPATDCGTFAGETFSLPRAVAGDDILPSLLTRIRGVAWLTYPDSQWAESGRPYDRRKAASGSLTPCSVLSPSYQPAGMGASRNPSHAAGSGKCPQAHETQVCGCSGQRRENLACSQPSFYPGSILEWRTCSTQAVTSASRSQGSSFRGVNTQAAASAPNSTVIGFIQQSPFTAVPQLGSGSQSNSADVPPPASLAGSPSDQPSPSSDLGVEGAAQEPRRQRTARRGPVSKGASLKTEAASAASSLDAEPALDAAIPRPADATVVKGGEQDASVSAPGSPGSDVSSQPTMKASRGRRAKLQLVEDEILSSSTGEDDREPRKGRRPRNAFLCPPWDVLMSTIKGKPRTTLLGQQGLGAAPEGSANEVLQALSTLLGLPYETVAECIDRNPGLQKHEKIERLITIVELYQEYGLSTEQLRSLLKANPKTTSAFSRDPATLRQILDFLLEKGVTTSGLGPVLISSNVAGLSVEDKMEPKATFLSSLGAGSVGSLLAGAPNLLGLKLSRLQGAAQVLRATLGEEGCAWVLERNARVLAFPTKGINAFIQILLGRYHLGPGVLAPMLSQVNEFPKTTVDRMEATLDLLESVVGRECVVDLLKRLPELLLRDTTTVQNLLRLMTPAAVRDLLVSNPAILRYDWSKSIEPALRYVVERCGVSYEDAVRARVFGRSFEQVVKPRVEFVLSQGMVVAPTEQGKRKKGRRPRSAGWGLFTILQSTVKRFQRRFPRYTGK